jgi:tubulin-specific chaperone E
LAALKAKYVEALQGGNEMVVLGSSNGAIEVEAVNLDIIRRNLASLENLRAVSLDDVASAESPGDIAKNCPSLCRFKQT